MKAGYALALLAVFSIAGCLQNTGGAQTEALHVDFLYWQNCTYCVQMKPNVEAAASEFGGAVELRMLDAELRGVDGNVTAAYEAYKADGRFKWFPTLVAGNNATLVGLQSKEEVRNWLCGQFQAKPRNCG